MTALTLSAFSFPSWSFSKTQSKAADTIAYDDDAGRRIVGDMIAGGACDSEYGVQMLMSVYPHRF